MRKLRLLLSAGTMLGMAAGVANAEMFPPNAAGSDRSPSGTSMLNLPSGFEEVGSPYTGGQGQQYTPTASSYNLSPFSTPAPGTVNVRFDLRLDAFGEAAWWSGMNGSGLTATTGAGNKEQPYGIYGFVRIDIGLDGMSKNGIRYGAFTEIRENSQFASFANTGVATAASPTSSGISGANGTNTLYVRQAWAYIGTDQLGIIRVGQGFSANSLLQIGLNDEFDSGGWIGWAGSLQPSAVSPVWPWADSGNEYQAARIGYLSPVLAGFDFVTSFAPNATTMFTAPGCSATYNGCISQSSSNLASDLARWRNQFEIGLRYRNSFGPIGLAVSGVWTTSGTVNPSPFAPTTGAGAVRYNGLDMGMVGAEVSVNQTLAIGGNILFGDYNGSWGLQNKPIAAQTSTTTAISWVGGARYTFLALPATVGASYFNYKYQGQPGLPTQRVSQGIDVGATYGLGPGIVIVAEYLWGQNSQGGYNFLTGACSVAAVCASTTGAAANNKVQTQMAVLGMSLRF